MRMRQRIMVVAVFLICVTMGILNEDSVASAAVITEEYLFNLPDIETDLSDTNYANAKEWKVTSAEGFKNMSAAKLSGCTVYLANDIDGVTCVSSMDNVTFDGLNHTIRSSGVLFGTLTSCTIRNVNVNGQVSFSAYIEECSGIIAYDAIDTEFSYCNTSGSITNVSTGAADSKRYMGGLVGKGINCTFTACSNSASITYPMSRINMDDEVYIGGIVGSSMNCDLYGCYQKSATLGNTFYWSAYGITLYNNGCGMVGYDEYAQDISPVIEGCYCEANLVTEATGNPIAGGFFISTVTFSRNYVYKTSSINNQLSATKQATYVGTDMNAAEIAWKMNCKDGVNNGWWTVSSTTNRPVLAASPEEAIYRYKWTSSNSSIYSTYGTEYYNSGKSIVVTISDVPAGYQFNGIKIGDTLYEAVDNTCTLTMPAKDVTAVYDFSLKKYDVTYHLDGGTNAVANPAKIDVETACTLGDAQKEGYRFMGWYDNETYSGTPVTEITVGTEENLELWAKFEKVYTITYMMDGGTNHAGNPADFVATESVVLKTPFKEGYTFLGWFTDSSFQIPIEQIAIGTMENQTVYAYWKINEYTISFNAADYPGQEDITLPYGTDLSGYEPAEPTKPDYLFGGWYTSQRFDEKFEFTTMPNKNVTLYAKWYQINMEELSYSRVSDVTYSGYEQKPSVIVKDGDYTLIKGINYNIEYRNNLNPGTASIVITGKGIYTGEYVIPFKIKKIAQQIRVTSLFLSKKLGDAPFNLGITTVGEGKVSYSSSNTVVATVNQTGVVTLVGAGSTSITVTMAETPYYSKTSCIITLKVDENPVEDENSSQNSNSSQNVEIKVGETAKVDGITYKVTSQEKNKQVCFEKADSKLENVVIPATVTINGSQYEVTAISKNAFTGCKKLTKVTIGKNVTSIGANAFSGCSKLKTVSMGSNVTTIGDKAFYKCTTLNKVTIPSKVTKIGKQAFYGCKKLKTITIKTTKLSSSKVGSKAFRGIYSKVTIKVPKSKLTSYKRLLKAKGVGSKAKIKK